RPRSHLDRNLGRSGGDAKLPPDQGRIGFGLLHDVDRKHPLGESENRPHYRALGDRRAAQPDGSAADRDLGICARSAAFPYTLAPKPWVATGWHMDRIAVDWRQAACFAVSIKPTTAWRCASLRLS